MQNMNWQILKFNVRPTSNTKFGPGLISVAQKIMMHLDWQLLLNMNC